MFIARIKSALGLKAETEMSIEDVIHKLYDRLESAPLNPVWICLVPREQALQQAKTAGPLQGMTFAVKDNFDVAGLPTTAACPAYSYQPKQTAFAVQRLLDAGAVLIGKTNMDQFATGLVGTRSPFGACHSVFDERYISGGSSSGSAVAVASGLVTFGLGTDTAGSGRVPAAFNNIVGLKPTRGLISTSGVVPACRSLDCVSIFARTVEDAAAVLAVAQDYDSADPFSRRPVSVTARKPTRYGVPTKLEFFGDSEYERLYRAEIERLRKSGATIVSFDLEPFLEAARLLYGGPYVAERFAAVGEFAKANADGMDQTVAKIILGAEKYTAAEAYAASYRLASLKQETEPLWTQFDQMLLPTAPTTYTIEEVNADPIRLNAHLGYYTNFVNLMDLSAVAVPAGFTSQGLPFGVTLIAPAFHEASLLNQRSTGIELAVLGAHLTGQPLNSQLTERKAVLVRTVKTAPDYKLYALTNTKPQKPGLIRVPGFAGPGVEAEIWSLSAEAFGTFVAAVPPPLGIGTCEMNDGTTVKCFICEPYAVNGMADITHFAGWRNYLAVKTTP